MASETKKPVIAIKSHSADFDTLGGDDCIIAICYGTSKDGYGFDTLPPETADEIIIKINEILERYNNELFFPTNKERRNEMEILMRFNTPCDKCNKEIALVGGYGQRTHEAGHLESCEDYLR